MKSLPQLLQNLALAACFGASMTLSRAQEPPQELRERAAQLEEQAQDLRASGQPERAMRMAREAEELQIQAAQRQERMERARRDRSPEEQQELRQVRRRLMAELGELQRSGRAEAAADVERRIAELNRALGEPGDRPDRPRWQDAPDRPRMETTRSGMGGALRNPEAQEQRIHHLEVAIDNLRAAGLPEIAERLQGQLAEWSRPGQNRPPLGPMMERVGAEMQRLRAEVEELRANLGELREEIRQIRR